MSHKQLTILHSNDLHGDFLPHTADGEETGGLSRLSGYVKKVRAEEANVIYANAGDMFRGSVIDSEYLGLSTIELMNLLNPDVSAVGNHEVDYGIAHLLFLEKCARFPIINADLFITFNNALSSTLSRTLMTSITTLLVLLVMFFLGGESIRSFIFAMILGVIVGTCASLFVASPVAYALTRRQVKKAAQPVAKK